jgi:hypothetical protein
MILNRTLLAKHPRVHDHLVDVLSRLAEVTAHCFVDDVLPQTPPKPYSPANTVDLGQSEDGRLDFPHYPADVEVEEP